MSKEPVDTSAIKEFADDMAESSFVKPAPIRPKPPNAPKFKPNNTKIKPINIKPRGRG